MTPNIICAMVGLITVFGLRWLTSINWNEYNKINSGEEPKGNDVNNIQFNLMKNDPNTFLEKLNLRPYQQEAISDISENINTVNSWARRSGKDTIIAAAAIHSAIFNPYSIIVIYVPAIHIIDYMKNTINNVLIQLLIPDISIVNKNSTTIYINNSKIIIKSILCKPGSSSPDIIFFNECKDEQIIQERIDLEKHENTTFHVFGTYSITLDEQYKAKYTKVSWKDFLDIKEAKRIKNNIGNASFSIEFN